MMHNSELTDRFRGCLMGLAVGDAVGTTVEFMAPGSFAPSPTWSGADHLGWRQDSGPTIR
jgi:ADP-ribosyl-[dinitrogen reductase] hydrolase